jgi:uncharacterized repeat protein (TIGR01451 family)
MSVKSLQKYGLLVCSLVVLTLVGFSRLGHVAASGDGVDEIKYSFGDTDDSVVFDWRGSEATIYYGLDDSYGQTATAQPSAITPQNGTGPFEEATLTGLQQSTVYHYKIGVNGLDHTFQTVPAGSFNWVDVGDTMGSACDLDTVNNGSWMPAEQQLIASQNPAFVTHGGDIAVPNQCGLPALHQYFIDQQVWSEHAAFQPVWGDHEWETAADAYKSAPDAIDDSNSNYKGRVFMTHAQTSPADNVKKTSHPGCGAPQGSTTNTCLGEDWGWFKAGGVLYISYPETSYNSWVDWQSKADVLMAQAQTDPSIDFIVTYGHRPPITDSTIGSNPDAYAATQALAAKYSPTASNPGGKYVLSVGHHAHSMEAFKPIGGLTYIINAAGGQGLTNWTSSINSNSVWRLMHFGLLSANYSATTHTLRVSMVCGPHYAYEKGTCNYGDTLYTTSFTRPNQAPTPEVIVSYSDGVTTVQSGQQVTYAATLTNPGNSVAVGTAMTATLPVGSQFVSADDGVVPAADGTVTWNTGDLPVGQSVTKHVTIQLGSQNPGDGVTSQVAATAADTSCQVSGSVCTATDTDTVPYAKLATSLDDTVTDAAVGDTLHYAATVQNTQADSTATGVVLSVTVPSNLTITDTGGGTVTGDTVSWPATDLAAGQSFTGLLTAGVTGGTPGATFTTTAAVQAAACSTGGSVCAASDTDTIPGATPQITQYITNGSVEASSTGWTGLINAQSQLKRVTNDAYDGSASLQITRIDSATGPAGDISKPVWVSSTVAGTTYTGSVWVRGQTAGQTITLELREVNGGGKTVSNSTVSGTFWDTDWHQLSTTYQAQNNGDSIKFIVSNPNLTANNWFHMDQMSLTSPM